MSTPPVADKADDIPPAPGSATEGDDSAAPGAGAALPPPAGGRPAQPDIGCDDIDWLEREYALLFGGGKPPPGGGPGASLEQRVHAWCRAVQRLAVAPEAAASPGPVALCLSGGGIRSATFGLGVLQGLARNGWLQRFDYLSTVSGGGYIGSWFATWIAREQRSSGDGSNQVLEQMRAAATARAPGQPAAAATGAQAGGGSGPGPVAAEPDPLRRLRAYSNFLSPAVGLTGDMMALVAIFLRNLVVRWMVLLPLLCAALLLPRVALAGLDAFQDLAARPGLGLPMVVLAVLAAVGLVGFATAFMAADLPELHPNREPPLAQLASDFWRCNGWPLLAASVLLSLIAPWFVQALGPPEWFHYVRCGLLFGAVHAVAAYAGVRWRRRRRLRPRTLQGAPELQWTLAVGFAGGLVLMAALWLLGSMWPAPAATPLGAAQLAARERYALLAVPAMVGVFWFTVTLYAVFTRPLKSEFDREWWARAAGLWLVVALGWLGLGALVLVAPRWSLEMLAAGNTGSGAAGSAAVTGGAALLGIITSIWGYWSRNSHKLVAGTKGLLQTINARALDLAAGLFIMLLGVTLALASSALLALMLPAAVDGPAGQAAQAAHAMPAAPRPQLAPAAQAAHLLDERRRAARLAVHCARTVPPSQTLQVEGLVVATLSPPAQAAPPGACPKPQPSAAERYRAVLHAMPLHWLLGVWIALLVLGLSINARAGTNVFSLHGLYGNRLIRAYLGASVPEHASPAAVAAAAAAGTKPLERRPHRFTGFDPADNLPLAQLLGQRPFLVVNAALNLTQSSGDRLEWQQRKAASFTFTPMACGSPVLGHAPTLLYGRKQPMELPDARAAMAVFDPAGGLPQVDAVHRAALAEDSLSVGRAMAISGAAASPNMGYHSSPVVAFAMSFFNVRLGWWLPNPRPPVLPAAPAQLLSGQAAAAHEDEQLRKLLAHWGRDEPAPGLNALWAETLGQSSERSESVYLSDGGHFDNMGLYEVVRRRCHRIVLVDATADADFVHADLQSTLRKIRIDLGVDIEFPHGVPDAASTLRLGKPWALGRVRYDAIDPGAPDGSLLYIKPALWAGLPLDVQRYAERSRDPKGRRPPFPHQSTSDQFFDEAQFESYRLLGLLALANALPDFRWPQGQGPDHRLPEPPAAPSAAQAASPAPAGP